MTPDAVRFALHSGQSAVFCDPSRYRVVVAGRRWGKTQLCRVELILSALNGKPGRYWYVAPDRIMAKDLMWAPLKAALDPSWVAGEPRETELSVTLRNGAELRLMGAEDPDRLRGRGLRKVILDEYADMHPEAWTEVIRPQLSDYEAPALFVGTPKSFNHLYDAYMAGQDAGRPGWKSWQFVTASNPAINPAEIEAAKHELDERTFRQEYEASFEAMAGRAYYAFVRSTHVRSVLLDPEWPASVCCDFNLNPATAVIYQRIGDQVNVWREVRLSHAGGEATRAVATKAKHLLAGAGHRGDVRIYGDASGKAGKTTGPSDHAVLREVFPTAVWCIPSANPHVRDRVNAVNGRLSSMRGDVHMAVDPSCVGLIADLEQVIFADNGDLDKRSNPALTHLSDALGYGVARDFPVQGRSVSAVTVPRDEVLSGTVAAIRAQKSASLRAQLEAMRG